MKFTSEDLLKAMGLKIGDVIKTGVGDIFKIIKDKNDDNFIYLRRENNMAKVADWNLSCLINTEFEILPQPKKVGDMRCDEMVCRKCPLRTIDCDAKGKTLYEALEIYRKHLSGNYGSLKVFEKTIIGVIKAELDKEVQEWEK